MDNQVCVYENAGKPCVDVRCDECPFRYGMIFYKPVEPTASTDDYVPKINFQGWPDHMPDEDIEKATNAFMPICEREWNAPNGDVVNHPPHYARWKMEPIEFIAINDLPWWLANVIKYTMRYDAKDGLQDLYKARSYLEMKIRQLEGEKRFWDKPVSIERELSH